MQRVNTLHREVSFQQRFLRCWREDCWGRPAEQAGHSVFLLRRRASHIRGIMMLSSDFVQQVLRWTHGMPHVDMSFAPLSSPDFDLSVEYLQSLMMVVAMVLAIGFTILVGLALVLCAIISFAQPLVWPSWLYRLSIVALSIVLVVVANFSLDGTDQLHAGQARLLDALDATRALLLNVSLRSDNLTAPAESYNDTITATAVCLGCFDNHTWVPEKWVNFTRSLCGLPGHLDLHDPPMPGGLLSAGPRALAAANEFHHNAHAGPDQATHTAHVVIEGSVWHEWAAILPLYALTLVALACGVGAIAGRRSLLLLAQFVGVIVWWMMCAVISVEFAIAVGLCAPRPPLAAPP